MFFVFGGFYILYLLYLMVRAYAELRLMPYFGEYDLFASIIREEVI